MSTEPSSPGEPTPSCGMPGFTCVSSRSPHAILVTLSGELDLAGVPRLDDALREAAAPGVTVVVDLRRLTFIDGSGAHRLLRADRRIREAGGRMVVVRGGEMVSRFFGRIGLDRELAFVDRPPIPTRAAGKHGHPETVTDGFERRRLNATAGHLAAVTRRLEIATSERDELRARVGALEQELLDLLFQPTSPTCVPHLSEA